jgi:hypothetical protein
MTLDEAKRSSLWKAHEADVPNFGFTADTFWFRIPISVERNVPNLILEVGYALLDEVDFFVDRDGEIVEHYKVGNAVDFNDRPIKHPLPIFRLKSERKRVSGSDCVIGTATAQASAPLLWGTGAELGVAGTGDGAGWAEAGCGA